jgi:hypothetical protein
MCRGSEQQTVGEVGGTGRTGAVLRPCSFLSQGSFLTTRFLLSLKTPPPPGT